MPNPKLRTTPRSHRRGSPQAYIAADKAQKALEKVYGERKTLTRDVGGTAGTTQFTDAMLAAME